MITRACCLATAIGVIVFCDAASAQEATSNPPSAPTAAQPLDAESTALPDVVVETQAKPAHQAKAKKKTKAKVAHVPSQTTTQPASVAGTTSLTNVPLPATGIAPVQGYSATATETGMKTDTPLGEIPQSVSVVGQEEMRDQGSQNLQQAVRYVPGVVADAYGLDTRGDSSIIRGTEAAEYIDGLRSTYGYYFNKIRIDPFFMERVEVLRGPASVLYGQAPVGGIINAVSKRPQETPYNGVTVEYGNFDHKQVAVDSTGPLTADGKWLYRITGLARDSGTQTDYVDDDRLALAPAITYRPTADTSVTVLGNFRRDRGGATPQFLPIVGTLFASPSGFIPHNRFTGEPGYDYYNTDAASVSVFVDHKFDDVFRLRSNLRYSDISNETRSYYPNIYGYTGQSNFPFEDPEQRTVSRDKGIYDNYTQMFNSDTNLEAKFVTGILSHKVLGGLDYSRYWNQSRYGDAIARTPFDLYAPVYGQPDNLGIPNYDENGNFTGFTDVSEIPVYDLPSQDIQQIGIYAQDQIRLGNWIAVLGLRNDWVDNATQFSPTQRDSALTKRAGLMYEFASGFTPYISYGESFIPEVGVDRNGKAFKPHEGRMTEVGFKYQVASNFVINSSIYEIHENNRLAGDPIDPNFSVQTGKVKIRGFDFEGIGNVTTNLKLIAGYSYTDAKYTDGDQAGFHVESVPAHLASLWAVYSFNEGSLKGWSVGGGVRYIGPSWDGFDQFQTPDATLFDAMLAYETDKWRWAINATNLEDQQYLSTCLARGDCFLGVDRTVISSLTYKF